MMQSLSDPNVKDNLFLSNLETKEANRAIYKDALSTGLSKQEITKCASASTEEHIFQAIFQQTKEKPKEVTSVPFFVFVGKEFNLPNARRRVVGLSILI